jgi:hypothetical protein
MLIQISIGSGLILFTILISGLSYLVMEGLFLRLHGWLKREPHAPKQLVVLCVAAIWVLALVTIAVWIWAFAFRALGIFVTMEAALYFSLVSFTTLGFGDVLLPQDWRLLAGMIAANGLLNIGLYTAILLEVMRQLRLSQVRAAREP